MKRLPLPPVPASVQPDMRVFLAAMRDNIEILMTGLGSSKRRSVTFDDLVALGLITPAQAEARAKEQV